MKGYRIVFFRHGMTEANTEGRYIGTTDLPLSSEGAKQLYEKLEKNEYPPVQKVYTSPLKRCIQTVNILQPNRLTAELPQLREMDFGDFEGKTADELMDRDDYKKFLEGGLDNPPPNGESVRDVMNRCYEALNIIISDMMYEGLTYVGVCTHSGIIMDLMSGFGVPKARPIDYVCDFGEGFEVLITASMWQRSEAFEVIGSYPPKYELMEDYKIEEI